MIRNCTLSFCVLALAATFAQPAFAQGDGKLTLTPEDLEEINKLVGKSLGDNLKALEESLKKEINGKLETLQAEQKDLKKQLEEQKLQIKQLMDERKNVTNVTAIGVPTTDKDIRDRLAAIENALTKLSNEQRVSTSFYSGSGISTSARMNLVNVFSDKIAFKVNGMVYIVAPNTTKTLDVPVGTVSYDVYSMRHGLLDIGSANLIAGETHTLTVFPKR